MRSMKLVLVAGLGCALLAGSASAAEQSTTATTANDENKLICRKTLETGSLVRKTKECFTQAEWDQIAEIHRRGNQKLVDGLTERSTGK